MGKLVLFLADGTLLDVPLDKERLTIGRRPDNDVCLPYPAVSGEHAAVVTILADSFLEDLGSTNGTLVNGKAVLKHFLRDHDVIDIGRQRLVYESDNEARVEPLPPDMLRHQVLGLEDQVAAVRPANTKVSVGGGRRAADNRDAPLLADLDLEVEQGVVDGAFERAALPAAVESPAAAKNAPAPHGGLSTRHATKSERRLSPSPAGATGDKPPVRAAAARAARVDTEVPAPDRQHEAALATGPRVRVVSGPNSGRSVAIVNDQVTVGRVGLQVAAVRKVVDGYLLVPLEGATPPNVNGVPVAADGATLRPGDTFEVAGVRLELVESA
jgi:hypothetical protein